MKGTKTNKKADKRKLYKTQILQEKVKFQRLYKQYPERKYKIMKENMATGYNF